MQFESKGKEEFVDLKAELLVEGSLERWKFEREVEWQEVKRREEESRLNDRPAPPSKCLYEQLREKQEHKEAEREQKRSLKNYVYTGPSEEELNLIQNISSNEEEQRVRIAREERMGLEEFRRKIESVKREEFENEQQQQQEDIITPTSTDKSSSCSQKKTIMSSVVIKPKRKNKKRGADENGNGKQEINSKSRRELYAQVLPAAKRPALVSYSSDSDIEKECMKTS